MFISNKTMQVYKTIENNLKEPFHKIDEICLFNSQKVLSAFLEHNINENHFNSTTGYGYGDLGREAIESVYASVFKSEAALVRNQFVSGSHALAVTLFALLRPNDTLLSITGLPYDTLHEVIGIKENKSSLKSFGIHYEQIDLIENDFDYDAIKNYLENNPIKVIEIQRSKGYSIRDSLSLEKLEKVISFIKKINKEVVIMVDNCYCEFVTTREPIEVGADIVVGSLIKNLGGGIAPNGAYVVGRKDLIELCGERLTLPGEGMEVGPTLGINKQFLQGIYMAPGVVRNALKSAILTSAMLDSLGYKVSPKYHDERVDIVQNIEFGNSKDLIRYCQGIQKYSPIDSGSMPIPGSMPGYDDQIIMASGAFTQGSSIELSCDGPLRVPYIAYQQGGLTYEYSYYTILKAIDYLVEGNEL